MCLGRMSYFVTALNRIRVGDNYLVNLLLFWIKICVGNDENRIDENRKCVECEGS